jgi:peptide/nickel transport system permease protein
MDVAAIRLTLQRLFRRKVVLFAAVLLLFIVLLAIFAPLVAPYSPTGMRVSQRLRPPSATNWFGTD